MGDGREQDSKQAENNSKPCCKACTKSGERCQMTVLLDSEFCYTHDPLRAQDRAASRARGGRHRGRGKLVDMPEKVSLRSVPDVQVLLEATALDTWNLDNSATRSRALSTIAEKALKALETSKMADFETRLAAVEKAQQGRPAEVAA